MKPFVRILPHLLVGAVLLMNVQCAALFLLTPEKYVSGFSVSGIVGRMLVQSLGILFIMWNIPYFFAVLNPYTHRVSLIEAAIMQTIGWAGETLLFLTSPEAPETLRGTVQRFIFFDGAGLIFMAASVFIVYFVASRSHQNVR